jgi:hypothetical protein
MRWTTSLAAVAAGAVPLIGLGAGHAEAATASAQRSTTFHVQGTEVTCTVLGVSSVEFSDEQSHLFVGTALVDDDQLCHDAIVETLVSAQYLSHGETTVERLAGNGHETTGASASVNEVVTSLDASHTARFTCDEAPRCEVSFTTSPK